MNKADAKKFACRLVAGFLEELYVNSKDPLVYDEYFQDLGRKIGTPDAVEGRRLSKVDEERVLAAMEALLTSINEKGWSDWDAYVEMGHFERRKMKWPRPAGKPRARWSKYTAWQKRQGRA